MQTFNDYPIDECAAEAGKLHHNQGATIYQKFTCSHCKARQTMEEPNKFFRSGKCEECGGVTIITRCNYQVHFKLGR